MRAACIQFLNEQDIAEASCVWFEMMISIVFSAILRCRYKILNPEKFRGTYGKLIHMLQDSVKDGKLTDVFTAHSSYSGLQSLQSLTQNSNTIIRDNFYVGRVR